MKKCPTCNPYEGPHNLKTIGDLMILEKVCTCSELLAALKEAQAVLAGTELYDEDDQSPLDKVREQIATAIARATGEAC